jgi:polyadenylate-binding protein
MSTSQKPSSDLSPSTYLFVKCLPKEWTHSDLHNAFLPIGSIVSAKVSLDKDHKSKGYGYINFESPLSSKKAIEEMDGLNINGVKLSVSEYKQQERKASESKFTNLYVKNFPSSVTSD